MDVVVNVIDTAVDFTKNTINKAIKVWDGFDEDKKKLCTVCAVAAVCLIVMMAGLFLISYLPVAPQRKIFHMAWFCVQSLLGFGLYFATAFLLRMDELQTAYNKYLSRFFRRKKASPAQGK